MMLSILAAAMLQATPYPARCSAAHGSIQAPTTVVCDVVVAREGNAVGVGFRIEGHTIIFSGYKQTAESSSVVVITIDDNRQGVDGLCVTRQREVGCTVTLPDGQPFTVVSQR